MYNLAIWPWRSATERYFIFAPKGFVFDGDLHGVQRPMLYTRKATCSVAFGLWGTALPEADALTLFNLTAALLEVPTCGLPSKTHSS